MKWGSEDGNNEDDVEDEGDENDDMTTSLNIAS